MSATAMSFAFGAIPYTWGGEGAFIVVASKNRVTPFQTMLDAIRVPCFAAALNAPMNATRVPFAGMKFARLGSPTETNRLEYGSSVPFCAMQYTMPPDASALPAPPRHRVVSL